jgi:hypothetical protein
MNLDLLSFLDHELDFLSCLANYSYDKILDDLRTYVKIS